MATRSLIYLSYSSSEKVLERELRGALCRDVKLAPLVWDDEDLLAGDFDTVYADRVAQARVMIMLVSPRYLRRDECRAWRWEIPPALEASQRNELTLLWLMTKAVAVQGTPFENLQAAYPIERALADMEPAERKQVYDVVKRKLRRVLALDKLEAFDVFASHNSEDKPAVRDVVAQLARYGVVTWLDENELQPGLPIRSKLETAIRDARSIAVFIGKAGDGPWQQEEVSSALDTAMRDGRPVIPVLLPGAQAPTTSFLNNRTWVDLRDGIVNDAAIQKLVWGITGRRPMVPDPVHAVEPAPPSAPPAGPLATPVRGPGELRFQDLGLFTDAETRSLERFADLIRTYVGSTATKRPLSLAVFGAPGSGKSRLVKELPKRFPLATLAALVEINLTQIGSTDDLGAALARAGEVAGKDIPFVFFDEFDASAGHGGAPWAWLSWFLAPMQDGVFRSAGLTFTMKRAVFVFAGGTAPTFDQLGRSAPQRFRAAKGPDFVSRLRGYLDLPGINARPRREDRRRAVLDHQLGDAKKQIDAGLRAALLNVGRYKHGARSMEALVELLPATGPVSLGDFRQEELLAMHVDRGALDPDLIGGCIGLSAGADNRTDHLVPVWKNLCGELFSHGARLAYGGRLTEGGLTAQLEGVVTDVQQELLRDAGSWIVISPGRGESRRAMLGVEQLARIEPRDDELPADLDDDKRRRWEGAIEQFRMRYTLAVRCVARFAVGGRLEANLTPRTKRFPGVVEDLMLALALGQPVYIAGHFGGGARWAGTLLGLGGDWTGPLPVHNVPPLEIPADRRYLFRPPGLPDLPLDREQLVGFFERHALLSPHWPNNGLSHARNRELFVCNDPARIAELVLAGLQARFS